MIKLHINDKTVSVPDGTSVAAAILTGGNDVFRRSVSGGPRLPLCGMGVCYECRVTINGVRHQRSCQTPVADGMRVETDE